MIHILQTLGLNEKQAAAYISALSLGTASVQQIAEKSGLKRSSVYLYLGELVHKKVMHKIHIGKKEYYQAVSPRLIEKQLEKNLASFRDEIQKLENIEGSVGGRPSVSVFEGEKGLQQLYEEIEGTRELIFWSDLSSVERMFPEAYRRIAERVAKKKIFTREILADTPETRSSSKRWAVDAGKYYASRLASGPIHNDSVLYDNVVCFFRFQAHNLFVVRIEDPTIAVSMKTLFDMAWQSAKPFITP